MFPELCAASQDSPHRWAWPWPTQECLTPTREKQSPGTPIGGLLDEVRQCSIRRSLCHNQGPSQKPHCSGMFCDLPPHTQSPSSISSPSVALALPWGSDLGPCTDLTLQPAQLFSPQKVQHEEADSMSQYWTCSYCTEMENVNTPGDMEVRRHRSGSSLLAQSWPKKSWQVLTQQVYCLRKCPK